VVHLSGIIFNNQDFLEAKHVAASVPGVKDVVSELKLEREGAGSR
jgi:osmotically-inducible protein OsmY